MFKLNQEFKEQLEMFNDERSFVLQYEILKDEQPLDGEETKSFVFHSQNLTELYHMLTSKGKEIKRMNKLKKNQTLENIRKGSHNSLATPQPTSLSYPHAFRVVSETLLDKPQMLSDIKPTSVTRFRQQFATAKSQVSTLDHMVYIEPKVQEMITFLFFQHDIIALPKRSEWETWSAEELVIKVFPLLQQGRHDKTLTERLIEEAATFRLHLDFNNVLQSFQPLLN